MGDPVLDAIELLVHKAPYNWDSYGAAAVTPDAMERARRCVVELQWQLGSGYAPPTVGPDADGGVELIWKSPRGVMHVLVGAGERFKVLVLREEQLVGPAQMKTLDELISGLKTHLQP